MRRNIDKMMNIKIPSGYDLVLSEFDEIIKRTSAPNQNIMDTVYMAYKIGFTAGTRYEKNRAKKQKNKTVGGKNK